MKMNVDRYLRSSRKHFVYTQDDDITLIKELFSDSNIKIVTIESQLARNEVIDGDESVIIWDSRYWKGYKEFAQIILSILSSSADDISLERELAYLEGVIFHNLTCKYMFSAADYALVFAKESISKGYNNIDFAHSYTTNLETAVKLAKVNLLSHEMTHIKFNQHTELEVQTIKTTQSYLEYLCDNPEVFEVYADYPELIPIIKSFPSFVAGSDRHLLMELADDVYSFAEGFYFIFQQFKMPKLAFSYVHGASVLRWYNKIMNTADGVIEHLLSRKNESNIYNDPHINRTNSINFFRYALFEPVMQIVLTQLCKELGFTDEQFAEVAKEIKEIRDLYNQRVVPRMDYLLRYRLHHILRNNNVFDQLEKIEDKRQIIDFLFSSPIEDDS